MQSKPVLRFKERSLSLETPRIMGVLNVTPDSFSDGGLYVGLEAAIDAAGSMVEAGASVLDVGGESTRPKGSHYGDGSDRISLQEELDRVLPVIEALSARFDTWISIDTWKAHVAREALERGASLVNDVSGLTMDAAMAPLLAETKAPAVLMHMRGTPDTTMETADSLECVVEDVIEDLRQRVQKAEAAGMERSQIVLDPGLGFGKRGPQNFELLGQLSRLRELDLPLLVGASRKSFLGDVTGRSRPADRDFATAATVAMAVWEGVELIRVHRVDAMMDVLRVCEAVQKAQPGVG